ncbi:MAG: MBL fold metallo-hydrolase [Betaproteobacteria bacterium]|nr:MBL fold metallo-hydrolase [Betaproteobacteria bacterium]
MSVLGDEGTLLVLDAGTGIRRLGASLPVSLRRVDILLTHLHMDHIQGLGFFAPLYREDLDVHLWGPGSATLRLQARLRRYLSPPLFPVNLSELPCRLTFHEVPAGESDIGEFRVRSALVCHPGPTVGYRITRPDGAALAYLPDHEPALAALRFPSLPRAWTSGADLAAEVDLLIHDGQYSTAEYACHCGWGHSSLEQAFAFGALAGAKHFVPFHHDPAHTDADIDRMMAEAIEAGRPEFPVTPGTEGTTIAL